MWQSTEDHEVQVEVASEKVFETLLPYLGISLYNAQAEVRLRLHFLQFHHS